MSLWFMFDNHTFQRLSDDRPQAAEEALECYNKHCGDYGMVGGKEEHEGVPVVHARGNKKAFREELQQWCGKELPLDRHVRRLKEIEKGKE